MRLENTAISVYFLDNMKTCSESFPKPYDSFGLLYSTQNHYLIWKWRWDRHKNCKSYFGFVPYTKPTYRFRRLAVYSAYGFLWTMNSCMAGAVYDLPKKILIFFRRKVIKIVILFFFFTFYPAVINKALWVGKQYLPTTIQPKRLFTPT